MTQPYFQVGEEVILYSKMSPELNGEYTVISAKQTTGDMGGVKVDAPYWAYRLTESDNLWAQVALRKKHTPGDDFQSLIHSLNNDKAEAL